jgi:cell wall-associated NlpC family hydrolase
MSPAAGHARTPIARDAAGRKRAPVLRVLLTIGVLGALTITVGGCATVTRSAAPLPFPESRKATVAPSAPTINVSGVLATALALEGTPYRNGGSSPAGGFDCSGLVQYVFRQHTVLLPRTTAEQFRSGAPVDRTHAAAGDLIFFSTTGPGPTHVGIVLDDRRFIHAPDTGATVRIERFDAPYWRSRQTGVRRVMPAPLDQ